MTYHYIWTAKSCSPTFKLNAGVSATGAIITKSVSIRNIKPSAINQGTTAQNSLQEIIGTFEYNNPFMLSIYKIEVNGTYLVEEDY